MVRICLINNAEEAQLQEQARNATKSRTQFDEMLHERSLPFTVVSCSGQDNDFPASELNCGAAGRGWQTSRFCLYPQDLVIELQWPSFIYTMQLLCHEYKISSKVEIYASILANGEVGSNHMKRLGHLSLDPNERTRYQARELKSIQINAPATAIRLVLHTCYSNHMNVYNQVGIMALIVTGEPLSEEQIFKYQLGISTPVESPGRQIPKPKVVAVDLSNVDSLTAHHIQGLQQEKSMAVQEEDYDEAKRLKILIERLKLLGEKIKNLELKKRSAVEEEDYDRAKLCKLEIEKLRQLDPRKFEGSRGEAKCETVSNEAAAPKLNSHGLNSHRGICEKYSQTEFEMKEVEAKELELSVSNSDRGSSSFQLDSASNETIYVKPNEEDELPPTAGGEEVLTPEPLSEVMSKEFSHVLIVMDQYHLECLLSKHWQLRDKALQFVEEELKKRNSIDDSVGAFRAFNKILIRGLNDKVSSVLFTSLQALRIFVMKYANEVPSRELHVSIGDIASILIEKLGDSNARTKDAATETLMFLALTKEIGLSVLAPLFLKMPKTLAAWRQLLGRLQWLLNAVPKFGLQPQNRLGVPGFSSEALMHFVVHCFNSPNGDVRNSAIRVTTEVYKLMGLSIEKYLKGIKPAIREALVAIFEKVGADDVFPSSSSSELKLNGQKQLNAGSYKQIPTQILVGQKGKNPIEMTQGMHMVERGKTYADRMLNSVQASSSSSSTGRGSSFDTEMSNKMFKVNGSSSSGRLNCSGSVARR